jgi:hypothetical protein
VARRATAPAAGDCGAAGAVRVSLYRERLVILRE